MRLGLSCLFLAAALAWGQRPTDEETAAAVELSRQVALNYGKLLPDFMCTQMVHRYQDVAHRGFWLPFDILTVTLSYYEHKEDHHLTLVNGKTTGLTYDVLQGAVTVGEFGGTLLQIFDPASRAAFKWEKWTHDQKRPAAQYTYQVDAKNSHYSLNFRSAVNEYRAVVGFHGVVEIDRETGEVLHFSYIADTIPKDFPIRTSQTMVDYASADIGGKEYLLPAFSETDMKSAEIWARNKAEFREYRKFSSESTVSFNPDKK